jgi:hypothetical protein
MTSNRVGSIQSVRARTPRTAHLAASIALVAVVAVAPLGAQGTLEDYRRASAINQRLAGLTVDIAQTPTWMDPRDSGIENR